MFSIHILSTLQLSTANPYSHNFPSCEQSGQSVLTGEYRVRINYRRILQNHIFTNTEHKYILLLPFERGMFAVSYSDHDIQTAIRTRVEPPQNCYIAQIPGHTNCARSMRKPFRSNTVLCFSREMAVATIGQFQMLRLLFVIDTNFTILRDFLLKLRRNEILQ
jgi:hypothetical protein